MKKNVLSLTEDGVITNPQMKLNKLYQYYITANREQSTYNKERVYSLKYVIEKFSSENDDLKGAIEGDFSEYLLEYFDIVKVKVGLIKDTNDRPILNISCVCTLNEIEVDLIKSVDKDNLLEEINKIYKEI